MTQDLLQSMDELNKLLEGIPHEELIQPHLDPAESPDAAECPYNIKNGSYLRVEDDNMKAWLYLKPPKAGENDFSRDEIVEFLKEHNVVRGYHESNISAVAKKHVYGREILVAQGSKPVEGENGYYEFFFETSKKRKPTIREDGTVDYSSMAEVSNVELGTKIAQYHHAIQGVNGYDVLGRETVAGASKDLPILKGRGFVNEGDSYFATVSGKIDYRDGHIDIKDQYEIRGDVDLTTGKVEFFGDIHISGNVGRGVVIRASRNVTIDGVVEAATIYAGGDIVMTRGIQGNQEALISAKGNVSAEFIEHATIEAGGNVRSNSFINANVVAAGRVLAEGTHGLILGGNVRGLLGVSAVSIGNEAETKTYVASGYTATDYENYVEAIQKENENQKLLTEVVDRMTKILKEKRLGREKNSTETDRELVALNEDKDKYFGLLDKYRTAKDNFAATIEKGKGSMILANEKIFRGVTLCIEGNEYVVPENTVYMKYKNEAGRIVPGVIMLN